VGTAAPALVASALVLAATAATARADNPCTGVTPEGGRFATCFDLGNRLSLTAGTDGFGGAIAVRHLIQFEDDPDLVWKMEHTVLDAAHAGVTDRFTGVVYRGRYIRHARDGHIVLPLFGDTRKVFLPFDIGALAEVGAVRWRPDATATIGVVKTAALVDLARSRDFHYLLAVGPVARWDVSLARHPVAIADHAVAPFTAGLLAVKLESASGLTWGELRGEAGTAWHSRTGWKPELRAEATIERIVLAINDRPISLVAGVGHDSSTAETTVRLGVRIAIIQHPDPRVSLDAMGGQALR
jgi:hypothetical protein